MNSTATPGPADVNLADVPDSTVDSSGGARFGTYRGVLRKVVLPPEGGLTRLRRHKRWIYTFVATPEVIALYAIVDLGYASNAFVLVADRASKSILFDRGFTGLPRPLAYVGDCPGTDARAGAGLDAKFHLPGADLRVGASSAEPAYRQRVQTEGLLWLGELAAKGPPALTVIAPVADGARSGGVNVTQKWAALEARGILDVGARSFNLNGGVGGIDYTNGYLARRTAWRWAFACGHVANSGAPVKIGINLVEGFNEAPGVSENALFIGNELVPLGRARFSWSKDDPLAPWRCTTEDGAIDLTFQPIGAHREERDLWIVRSRFVQPVGHFSGTVRALGRSYHVENLAGVTEDQDVVW